jgi:hypothetical protein
MNQRDLLALIKRKKGLLLDISLGGTPQPRSVTLSPIGDVKHDPRKIPFPLPDGCVNTAVVTHVLEYVDPLRFFDWFDELHRIMQPRGVVYLSGPYGGEESHGWLSDPQHRTRVLEQSFAWLDPRLPFYPDHAARGRRFPKPWHTLTSSRVPGTHGTVSYNVMLEAQPVERRKSPRLAKAG